MHVPPFEMQVLEVLGAVIASAWHPAAAKCADYAIAIEGNQQFGGAWSGAKHVDSYPKINAALGRLRSKGLVERIARPGSFMHWGHWRLTNQGYDFLGLAPILV